MRVLILAVALLFGRTSSAQAPVTIPVSDAPVVVSGSLVGVFNIPLLEGKMSLEQYEKDRGFHPDVAYRFCNIDQEPSLDGWIEICKAGRIIPYVILYMARPDPEVSVKLNSIKLDELKTKYADKLRAWKKSLASHHTTVWLATFSEADNYLNPYSVKPTDQDEAIAIRAYREAFGYVFGVMNDPNIKIVQSVLSRAGSDNPYTPYMVSNKDGAFMGGALELVIYVNTISDPGTHRPVYDLEAAVSASMKEVAPLKVPLILRLLVSEGTDAAAKAGFFEKMPGQLLAMQAKYGVKFEAVLIHDASDNNSYGLDSSPQAKAAAAEAIAKIKGGRKVANRFGV